MDMKMDLSQRIREKRARVSVIGLGYVGLPLSLEFLKSGFEVVGIDINKDRIKNLESAESYITDVSDGEIRNALQSGRFTPTSDFSLLADSDVISICVPTPLRKTKEPDISFIVSAVKKIRNYLSKEQLVILESTTYPGTTEEVVLPELEKTGLRVGKDFYLAFSPERIDPGNKKYAIANTPKIVGGITSNCTEMAVSFYSMVVEKVYPVSSSRAAEMVKLLENTFRAVNIGLVNEIAIIADRLKLDVWEIIDAAATKPFGFLPFYPGPGLGGHCIPVDPHYLSWKLNAQGYNPRFIELAKDINSKMPTVVVEKIADALNRFKRSINGSKILILGVAYKKDVGDIRESPALDVIEGLKGRGAEIFYEDRYCPEFEHQGHSYRSIRIDSADHQNLASYDCVSVLTDHSYYDWGAIAESAKIIVDCRNAMRGLKSFRDKIIKI
ncbi:MAG: nucleotide sugar dehydrogenase [Deltaproteobacteria bacterium]